jgi:hypothetical protein
LKVDKPLPPGSYDFADLSFYKLYHDDDLVGIIKAVESGDSIIFQLMHLAPENRFKIQNYYSYIRLFAELSKKYRNAYKIFKENFNLNPTAITPAKKKAYTSSPLVSNSFTPASPTLPTPSPTPLPTPSDELDELLKLREEINMIDERNCTVYAIISQLYPQTYGGYRLSSDNKTLNETYKQITLDKNV